MTTIPKDPASEKQKALDQAFDQLIRSLGPGVVTRLSERATQEVPALSTGFPSLDTATGVGGLPRGRLVELFGPESSGKSSLVLHAIASTQRMGGTAVYVDMEHAVDIKYCTALGVNVDQLIISQPEFLEQAVEVIERLVSTNAVDIVAVDSVAALVPRAELEGEVGEGQIALQAKLMSQTLRKLVGVVARTNTVVVFINQLRQMIGVQWGPTEFTPGGKALKFYASLRLEVRRTEWVKTKDGKQTLGYKARVRVVKNKVAPPFGETTLTAYYSPGGFSFFDDVVEHAIRQQVITTSGAFFSYEGQRLAQGRENLRDYFQLQPDMFLTICERVGVKGV